MARFTFTMDVVVFTEEQEMDFVVYKQVEENVVEAEVYPIGLVKVFLEFKLEVRAHDVVCSVMVFPPELEFQFLKKIHSRALHQDQTQTYLSEVL